MTCEVAVMNKRGIALAADSAVTLLGESKKNEGKKVYHTAEKLFPLSPSVPVAIMTFGAAEIFLLAPCRRFADTLADACARLGADVVRYSFIVVDLHHLLLAGLPAHL